jgi:hypothetical protein
MIDYNPEVVSALETVLPTYHELALTSKAEIPCYSYQERNNYVQANGDTLGYSVLVFTIKVWARTPAEIAEYSLKADAVLRPIGFKRTSSNELYDRNSTMIQKIMTYEALGLEDF